jgi:hypothetical protein
VPRPRQTSEPPQLSPGQASYVVERLIADRRVSAAEVNRYVAEMHREISTLEQRLNRLREAGGIAAATAVLGAAAGAAAGVIARRRPGRPPGPGRPAGRPGRPPGRKARTASAAPASSGASASTESGEGQKGGAKRGRKNAITAEQLASRQLQGRYLALVRRFPESRRSAFAKIAKEKGREAAIKEMQDAVKK